MYQEFQKIARLNREVVITEKIDGACGQIHIVHPQEARADSEIADNIIAAVGDGTKVLYILAGNRHGYLLPNTDSSGFASWVEGNAGELVKLGHGRHHGEWWGKGIGRGYGLKHNRFSLFNVSRWIDRHGEGATIGTTWAPKCCHVVPIVARGVGIDHVMWQATARLAREGSLAAPGYLNPEGLILYHTAGDVCFKYTFDKNDQPKGA